MFAAGVIPPRMYEANVLSPLQKEMFTALGAGVLWGTMYIPYRKAYLSGMNPLSFASFNFTVGELGMMTVLASRDVGGLAALWRQVGAVLPGRMCRSVIRRTRLAVRPRNLGLSAAM